MDRPLQTVWKGLILVSGTSALLSLSELVVKAKGFVVHLIEAYRLLWQEPIQWLAQWISVPWPNWASDVLLLWVVSNAAGTIAAYRLQARFKVNISDWESSVNELISLTHQYEIGGANCAIRNDAIVNEKFGNAAKCIDTILAKIAYSPSFYWTFILPLMVPIRHFQLAIWLRRPVREIKKFNSLCQIKYEFDVFSPSVISSTMNESRAQVRKIMTSYLIWIVSEFLIVVAVLISSYALFYIPASVVP